MQRLEEEEDDITEEEHVKHVLNSYAAEAHDGADGGVIPTEYLQEDLGVTLELPRSLQRMKNPVCLVVAAFPAAVVGLSLLVSCVASLWLASSPADLFSVSEELFLDATHPDCRFYMAARRELGANTAGEQMRAWSGRGARALTSMATSRHQRRLVDAPPPRRRLASLGDNPNCPNCTRFNDGSRQSPRTTAIDRTSSAGPAGWCEGSSLALDSVTLVHTMRDPAGGGSVLDPRSLAQMRMAEARLMEWARANGRCDPTPHLACECQSIDSFANYVFPDLQFQAGAEGAPSPALVYDAELSRTGAFPAGIGACARAPFSRSDAVEVMSWLVRRGHDGFFSRSLLHEHGMGERPPQHRRLPALRSTLRLRGMGASDWTRLAALLADVSGSSTRVQVHYGGSSALLLGELLASLSHDVWLLLIALSLVGVCLRAFFGCWRIAAVATVQMALGLPVMYWLVCVLGGQEQLSAVAASSLWVVLGLSADSVFVLASTWAQAQMLTAHGEPLSTAERLEWTVRQALPPLLAADLTAAFSILVNCVSPIPAVFQFGLCGGTLVLVNLGMVLVYLPPLLLLREQGRLGMQPHARPEHVRTARGRWLRSVHEHWFQHRMLVLGGFVLALLLLAPLAASPQPSLDETLTFVANAESQAIVDRSKGSADDLFPSPEGRYTTERAARVLWHDGRPFARGFTPPAPPPLPPAPPSPPLPPGAPWTRNAPPTLPMTAGAIEDEARRQQQLAAAAASRPTVVDPRCGCDRLFHHCGDKTVCLNLASQAECPASLEEANQLPGCDQAAVGELCEADGECGTDVKADNCPYGRGGETLRDVYRRVELPRGLCGLRIHCHGQEVCLEAVTEKHCPATKDACDKLPRCDQADIGQLCEADGECGTDFLLNNCEYPDPEWLVPRNRDIYRRVELPPSAPPGAECVHVAPHCAADGGAVALEPVMDAMQCPGAVGEAEKLPRCDVAEVGQLCEADGECGTDFRLNNCLYYAQTFWGALGAFTGDVYKRVALPASMKDVPASRGGSGPDGSLVDLPAYHLRWLEEGKQQGWAVAAAYGGQGYGSALGLVLICDGVLLLQLARALRCLRSVWVWHPPVGVDGPSAHAAAATAAAFALVLLVMGTLCFYLSVTACDFAIDARTLLGHALGAMLLVHAVALAMLCRSIVAHGGEAYGFLGPSDAMLRRPAPWTLVLAGGVLGCAMAGAGTLYALGASLGLDDTDTDLRADAFGWSLAGAKGLCFVLGLLWMYLSVILGGGACAAFDGESEGALRPMSSHRMRLAAAAIALHLLSWALLLLAGSGAALHHVFKTSARTVLGNLLALSLGISSAAHAMALGAVVLRSPVGLFKPSEWAQREPILARAGHAAAALGCAASGVWAFAAANNAPVPAWLFPTLNAPSHAPADARGSLAAMALGVVWACVAACAAMLSVAFRSARPVGPFRPMGPTGLRRTCLGAGAVMFGCAAVWVLIVARSPSATTAVFDSSGRTAFALLAPSLLLLSAPALQLTIALITRTPHGVFAPGNVDFRGRSCAIGAAGMLAVASIGGALVASILALSSDSRIASPGRFDGDALQLAMLAALDASLLFAAALAQATEQPALCFRPLTSSSAVREGSCDALSAGAGVVGLLAVAALFCAWDDERGSALFGSTRAVPLALQATLDLHALAFAAGAYAIRQSVALGPFVPPMAATISPWPARAAAALAAACAALSILQSVDEALPWQGVANVLFVLQLGSAGAVHLLFSDRVVIYRNGEANPAVVRWGAWLFSNALAACLGAAFVLAAFPAESVVLPYRTQLPTTYVLMVCAAGFCALNWLPATATMHAGYSGRPCLGLASGSAQPGLKGGGGAFGMLLFSLLCAAVGAGLTVGATVVVRLDASRHAAATGQPGGLPETSFDASEHCQIFWGARLRPAGEAARDGRHLSLDWNYADGAPELAGGLDTPAAQRALDAACVAMLRDDSPLNAAQRAHGSPPRCVMHELRAWLESEGRAFPVTDGLAGAMRDFLQSENGITQRDDVGFVDAAMTRVGWVRVHVHAKFAHAGTEALALLADPQLLGQYKQEWDLWLSSLDGFARMGVSSCPKWNLLATEDAFFRGVFRALGWTTAVAMVAVLLVSRSFAVAYAALYSLLGMVVAVLGLMRLAAMPLGVVEALSLSLIIGVAVGYIIHIAHAYTHALLPERGHKTRAVLLARAPSTAAAAATTLVAVAPLLFARLLPLRDFGLIFGGVAAVALLFSTAFLTTLMVLGPTSSPGSSGTWSSTQPRPEESRAEPNSRRGWELQVDVGEPVGAHAVHCGSTGGTGMTLSGAHRPSNDHDSSEML
mmetsp:Transcript_31762/g.101317  ORF Transcript_31762/g.101317 Transcript_31762/m.101317 type:complete len:2320 (+) Transcript_31762:93-7052(+)